MMAATFSDDIYILSSLSTPQILLQVEEIEQLVVLPSPRIFFSSSSAPSGILVFWSIFYFSVLFFAYGWFFISKYRNPPINQIWGNNPRNPPIIRGFFPGNPPIHRWISYGLYLPKTATTTIIDLCPRAITG